MKTGQETALEEEREGVGGGGEEEREWGKEREPEEGSEGRRDESKWSEGEEGSAWKEGESKERISGLSLRPQRAKPRRTSPERERGGRGG